VKAGLNLGQASNEMGGSGYKTGRNSYNETTFELSVYGGDQSLFDTDRNSWTFSADGDDSRLLLVGFKLAPIYGLAEWGSKAETLLRTAYDNFVNKNPLRDDYLDFKSKPILGALDAVYTFFSGKYNTFRGRYNSCWMACNDMKNGYESSGRIMAVVQKLKVIVKANSLAVAKSEYMSVYRTEIKGKNTCWGAGCKDSTHYNAHYIEAEKRLSGIYNMLS